MDMRGRERKGNRGSGSRTSLIRRNSREVRVAALILDKRVTRAESTYWIPNG